MFMKHLITLSLIGTKRKKKEREREREREREGKRERKKERGLRKRNTYSERQTFRDMLR